MKACYLRKLAYIKNEDPYVLNTICARMYLVQELHMRGTGRMDFGKQHTLLYSGSENSSHHGVGIIMKNELLPRLQWYRCVSDRVASCLLACLHQERRPLRTEYDLCKDVSRPGIAYEGYWKDGLR